MSLRGHGWSGIHQREFDRLPGEGLEPARVVKAGSGPFRVVTAGGERRAVLGGGLRRVAAGAADLPTVGDWVAVRADGSRIEHLLPRRTRLSRNVPGKRSREQVVAANVDLVIVVMGLDGDYSVRRVERYLTTAWESGARPLVLLNKADLCRVPAAREREVMAASPGVPVLTASCLSGEGLEDLRRAIPPGETAVLVGSSGAGKSTLINRLLGGDVQPTRATLRDGRGRHTTTHRELFLLPGGGLLIDSPGLRELQLWSGEDSLGRAFEDIADLRGGCRFRDCAHDSEPGCAVLEAVKSETLDRARLDSYRTLLREVRYLELRQEEGARRIEKQRWRAIHKEMRRSGNHR